MLPKVENALDKDMSSIDNYGKENKLLLNLKKGKTEVMFFRTAQHPKLNGRSLKIMYNNAVINFVTEYAYLGNLADNHIKNF